MNEQQAVAALDEAVHLMMRWTVNHVTGFCIACREITERDGGTTPNVLSGEPHRRECPIGAFIARAGAKSNV